MDIFEKLLSVITGDSTAVLLISVALIWFVLAVVARWIFARLDWAAGLLVSEVLHVLLIPVTWILIGFAVNQITEEVVALGAPGDTGAVISQFFLVPIRLILGFAVGYVVWRSLDLLRTEYAERRFEAWGSHRTRNLTAVFFQLAKPVSFLLIMAMVAWLFKLNLYAAVAAIGGLGVALGFALQQILANIIAGISLASDTTFGTNDLIRIGNDPDIYQVLKRGVRITTVRNIASHEVVFLPNQKLTEEQLVDVTRPSDDLRAVIDIGVPYSADLRDVRGILTDIANGHPHVIGDLEAKKNAILNKVFRLYIRGVFPECKWHFVELARLEAEHDLNGKVSQYIRKLQNWADFVDQTEAGGFDREERLWLDEIHRELLDNAIEVANLTTEWQVLFRNCTASLKPKGARFPGWASDDGEIPAKWEPEESDVEAICRAGLKRRFHKTKKGKSESGAETRKRLGKLAADLSSLSENITISTEKEIQKSIFSTKNRGKGNASQKFFDARFYPADLDRNSLVRISKKGGMKGNLGQLKRICEYKPNVDYKYNKGREISKIDNNGNKSIWFFNTQYPELAYEYIHTAFAAAHLLSDRANIDPEERSNRKDYKEADDDVKSIKSTYASLGEEYVAMLRHAAHWIVNEERIARPFVRDAQKREFHEKLGSKGKKSGFNIVLCRTRQEDTFISIRASEHIVDHPVCAAYAGMILDDDEKRDLVATFKMWGDKIYQLLEKVDGIQKELTRAKSTTIDTRLRELATWLKEDFKDPTPGWKFPIAPVEGFDDSSIHVTTKFYVDNVRMERYMRPFNTYTQMRLRIAERLVNAGIIIPFPQRDVHIKTIGSAGSDKEFDARDVLSRKPESKRKT